jgi:transposase
MARTRRTFTAEFKARVALDALKEQETLNQLASRYEVQPVQVAQWKALAKERMVAAFASGAAAKRDEEWERKEARLYQKIGQLEVERDWLKKKSEQFGIITHLEA